jgi:hypothetical protein
MAFLKFRGNSTTPTKPSSTTAANAPLTNADIDGNFASLNDSKLESTANAISATSLTGTSTSNILTSALASGTANSSTYLRGDRTWGSISAGGASLIDDTVTDTVQYLGMARTTTGTWTNAYIATTSLYFNPSSGTLNSTTFNSLSDIRYKKDIEKISYALDKLKTLSGYTFTLIDGNVKSTGLIAQEVKEVLPEAIAETNDKMTVSYGNMMGLIVEAIKELDSKLDSIQNQINNK